MTNDASAADSLIQRVARWQPTRRIPDFETGVCGSPKGHRRLSAWRAAQPRKPPRSIDSSPTFWNLWEFYDPDYLFEYSKTG